jgi:hypothetical protein
MVQGAPCPRRDTIAAHSNTDEWLSYYLARKSDHVNKLAIILAASRRDDLVITERDIADAILKCDAIEDELGLVFGVKDLSSRYADLNKKVWKYIHALMCQHGRLPARRVFGYTLSFMRHNEAKDLLTHLTSAGYLPPNKMPKGSGMSSARLAKPRSPTPPDARWTILLSHPW